jgi:hypothetical protein
MGGICSSPKIDTEQLEGKSVPDRSKLTKRYTGVEYGSALHKALKKAGRCFFYSSRVDT